MGFKLAKPRVLILSTIWVGVIILLVIWPQIIISEQNLGDAKVYIRFLMLFTMLTIKNQIKTMVYKPLLEMFKKEGTLIEIIDQQIPLENEPDNVKSNPLLKKEVNKE